LYYTNWRDTTKCYQTSDQLCYTRGAAKLRETADGGECLTVCPNLNHCYLTSDYLCKVPTSLAATNIAQGDGGECKTSICTDTTKCYQTSDQLCYTRGAAKLRETADGGECLTVCPNLNHCYLTSDYLCKVPTSLAATNIAQGDGGECKTSICTDTTKCYQTSDQLCYTRGAAKLRETADGGECLTVCPNLNHCYLTSDYLCKVPTSLAATNIAQGDGGECKTSICTDTTKCYQTSDQLCYTRGAAKLRETADGGECLTVCPNLNHCYLTSDYLCKVPTSLAATNIAQGDGGECKTSICTDTTKCYQTSDQLCYTRGAAKLRETADGGECLTVCPNLNHCYLTSDYLCKVPTSLAATNIAQGDGGECKTSICTDTTKCYQTSDQLCYTRGAAKLRETADGGECLTVCPNLNHCYLTSDYLCKVPTSLAATNIAQGDGGECKTSICTDTTKCYQTSDQLCYTRGAAKLRETADGGECLTVCPNLNHCYLTSDYLCKVPTSLAATNIAQGDGGECKTSICTDTTKCYQTSDQLCYTRGAAKLRETADGGECLTVCPNLNHCYLTSDYLCKVPTSLAATNIAQGDGGECKTSICTDTTKCYQTSDQLCYARGVAKLRETADGGQCLTVCPNLNHCYLTSDYLCKDPLLLTATDIAQGDGGECVTSSCNGGLKCYETANQICFSRGTLTRRSETDTGICLKNVETCPATKCYITNHGTAIKNHLCIDPNVNADNPNNFVHDTDLLECKSSCSLHRCHVDKQCQDRAAGILATNAGEICNNPIAECPNNASGNPTCYSEDVSLSNDDKYVCKTPNGIDGNLFGFIESGASIKCTTSCQPGECYNSTTKKCHVGAFGTIEFPDIENGKVACQNSTQCFNNQCKSTTAGLCRSLVETQIDGVAAVNCSDLFTVLELPVNNSTFPNIVNSVVTTATQNVYTVFFYLNISSINILTGTTYADVFCLNNSLCISMSTTTEINVLFKPSTVISKGTLVSGKFNSISLSFNANNSELLFTVNQTNNETLVNNTSLNVASMHLKTAEMFIGGRITGHFASLHIYSTFIFGTEPYLYNTLLDGIVSTNEVKASIGTSASNPIAAVTEFLILGLAETLNDCYTNFVTGAYKCKFSKDRRLFPNLSKCTATTPVGLQFFNINTQITCDAVTDKQVHDENNLNIERYNSCQNVGIARKSGTTYYCACNDINKAYKPMYINNNPTEITCKKLIYYDMVKYTTADLIPITAANPVDTQYTISVWLFLNKGYNMTQADTTLKWNNHLQLVIKSNSNSQYNISCNPYIDSISANDTSNVSANILGSYLSWQHFRCSADRTNKFFFMYKEYNISNQQTMTIPTTTTASTDDNFSIIFNNRLWGTMYVRSLQLWKCAYCDIAELSHLYNRAFNGDSSLLPTTAPYYDKLIGIYDFGQEKVNPNDMDTVYTNFIGGLEAGTIADPSNNIKLVVPKNINMVESTDFKGYVRAPLENYTTGFGIDIEPFTDTYPILYNFNDIIIDFISPPLLAYTFEGVIQISDISKYVKPLYMILDQKMAIVFYRSDTATLKMLFFGDDSQIRLGKKLNENYTNEKLEALYSEQFVKSSTTLASIATDDWLYFRVAVNNYSRKIHSFLIKVATANPTTDSTFSSNEYMYSFNESKTIEQNINTSSYQINNKLIISEKNTDSTAYIKNISIYNDYLPVNLDTRRIMYNYESPSTSTYPPYLAFALSMHTHIRELSTLRFLQNNKGVFEVKTSNWALKSTGKFEVSKNVSLFVQCHPDRVHDAGVCIVPAGGCQIAADIQLCANDTQVLSCTNNKNIDIATLTACIATADTCPDNYMVTPTVKSPSFCNVTCLDVNATNCTSGMLMSSLRTNFPCTYASQFQSNMRCYGKNIFPDLRDNSALYYSSCNPSPNYYVRVSTEGDSVLKKGYTIEVTYKRDILRDLLFSEPINNCDDIDLTKKEFRKYIFLSDPHSLYVEFSIVNGKLANPFLVYELKNGKDKGKINSSLNILDSQVSNSDSLRLFEHNRYMIVVEPNLSLNKTDIGQVSLYNNFKLLGSLTKIPLVIDNINLKLDLNYLGFCSSPGCFDTMTEKIYWLAGWYRDIKIWEGINMANFQVVRETMSINSCTRVVPYYHWEFNMVTSLANEILGDFRSKGLNAQVWSFLSNHPTTMTTGYNGNFFVMNYSLNGWFGDSNFSHDEITTNNFQSFFYFKKFVSNIDMLTTSTSKGKLTLSDCPENCRFCGGADMCYRCIRNYMLFNNKCVLMDRYYLTTNLSFNSSQSSGSELILPVKNDDTKSSINWNSKEFSMSIQVKYYNNKVAGCAKILDFLNSFICFDTNDYTLKFMTGSEVLFVDNSNFIKSIGDWIVIGVTVWVPEEFTEFDPCFNVYINGIPMEISKNLSQTESLQIQKKIYDRLRNNTLVNQFKISNEVIAVYANYRLENALNLNPGKYFTNSKVVVFKSLSVSIDRLSTSVTEETICKLVFEGISSTLSCCRDYNPHDKFTCNLGSFLNVKTGACESCHSDCNSKCINNTKESCSIEANRQEVVLTYTPYSNKCLIKYLNFLDFSKNVSAKGKVSVTPNKSIYGMDLWEYFCPYAQIIEKITLDFPIRWDKHLEIKFGMEKDTTGRGCSSYTGFFGQQQLLLNDQTFKSTNSIANSSITKNSDPFYEKFNYCLVVKYDNQYDSLENRQTPIKQFDYLPLCAWRKVFLGVNLNENNYTTNLNDPVKFDGYNKNKLENLKETKVDFTIGSNGIQGTLVKETVTQIKDFQQVEVTNIKDKKLVNNTSVYFGIIHISRIRLFSIDQLRSINDCDSSSDYKLFNIIHYIDPNSIALNVVDNNKLNELSNLSNIPTVNTFRDRVDSTVIFEYSLNSEFKGYYKLDTNIGEQYNLITQNKFISSPNVKNNILAYKSDTAYFDYSLPSSGICLALTSDKDEIVNNSNLTLTLQNVQNSRKFFIVYVCSPKNKDFSLQSNTLSEQINSNVYSTRISLIDTRVSTNSNEIIITPEFISIICIANLRYDNSLFSEHYSKEIRVRMKLGNVNDISTNKPLSTQLSEVVQLKLLFNDLKVNPSFVNAVPKIEPPSNIPKTENEIINLNREDINRLAIYGLFKRVNLNQFNYQFVNAKHNFEYENMCSIQDSDKNYCNSNGKCASIEGRVSCVCVPGKSGLFCNLDKSLKNNAENQVNQLIKNLISGINGFSLNSLFKNRVPSKNPENKVNENLNSRFLQINSTNSTIINTNSSNSTNFNQTHIDLMIQSVNLTSLLSSNLSFYESNVNPIIFFLNNEFENNKELIINNADNLIQVLSSTAEYYKSIVQNVKHENYISYLMNLNRSSQIQQPINISFVREFVPLNLYTGSNSGSSSNLNVNRLEIVDFKNVSNIDTIWEFMYNTGKYENFNSSVTNMNLQANNFNFTPSVSINVFNDKLSLTEDQKRTINNYFVSMNQLMSKIMNNYVLLKPNSSMLVDRPFIRSEIKLFNKQASNTNLYEELNIWLLSLQTRGISIDLKNVFEEKLKNITSFKIAFFSQNNPPDINDEEDYLTNRYFLSIYDSNNREIKFNNVKVIADMIKNNQIVTNYLITNQYRFYSNETLRKELNETYTSYIRDPYIINENGFIQRDISQIERIDFMHQFFNLTAGETPFVRVIDRQVSLTASSGIIESIYTYNVPEYHNKTNSYWWNRTEIFSKSENYNRAVFITLIIIFSINVILYLIFIIIRKTNTNLEAKVPLSSGKPNTVIIINKNNDVNAYSNDIISIPCSVGAKEEGVERHENELSKDDDLVVNYNSSNNNTEKNDNKEIEIIKSSCDAIKFYLSNGLYSFIFINTINKPRFKSLQWNWLYLNSALLFLSLFFNFSGIPTHLKPYSNENVRYCVWFVALTIVLVNVLLFILSFLYRNSVGEKATSNSINIWKSVILLLVNFAIFGFLFYSIMGFCAVFENFDYVYIVCFIITIIIDFLLMEIIMSLCYSCCYEEKDSFYCKILLGINAYRNGC
jgi:hypothetical protein